MDALYSIIVFVWWILVMLQIYLAYGTAYRLTKRGGDNGMALWGWLLVLNIASVIPGLGIYLWNRYKNY